MLTNRSAAGRDLAQILRAQTILGPAIVIALAPGGIHVAAQISAKLHLPLDLALVRELAVGIAVEGFAAEIDLERVAALELEPELGDVLADAFAELDRQALMLRGRRPPRNLWGYTVILVDDGTSSSRVLDAAIRLVHVRAAAKVILAIPTVTTDVLDGAAGLVDDLVCIEQHATDDVAYAEYEPLSDRDLSIQLARARGAA